MPAIAVVNQKGGCGKTTTAINLAAGLAGRQKSVLLVDMDPQGHATRGLGMDTDAIPQTIYEALVNSSTNLSEVIRHTNYPYLHLAPASIRLAGAQLELATLPEREATLKKKLEKSGERFDFVIIDCPPALNLLTINSLVAAHLVLIPTQTHFYSLEGMRALFQTVDLVREHFNPDLSVLGIVPTLFDRRLRANREMLEALQGYFEEKMFRSIIRYNVKLFEAPAEGKPIFLHAPKSAGALDYGNLTTEVLERLVVTHGPA